MNVLSAVAAVLVLGSIPAGYGQKAPASPGPAQPMPASAKAPRDGTTEIPLRIFGRRQQTLTFLIRTPPAAGKLSEPEKTGAESAIVRYTPPMDRAITRETFTYAVRSADGISAPVAVTIEIADTPAELIVVPGGSFGAVLVGSTRTEQFELTNRGGTAVEGTVEVDAPWRIEGSNRYRVEPKGRTFFRVSFVPAKSGTFSGEVRYSSHPDRVTSLQGEAQAVLEVRPESLTLQFEPISGTRSAMFELANNSDAEQTIVISPPERLQIERELRLAVGARAAVTANVPASDMAALDSVIRFSAGQYSASLPVKAATTPANLRFSADALTLRQDPAGGHPHRAGLTLENAGGTATKVTVTATPPFTTSEAEVALAPGEKRPVFVTVLLAAKDGSDGRLRCEWSGGSREIAVRLERAAARVPNAGRRAPSGQPLAVQPASVRSVGEAAPAAAEGDVVARLRTRLVQRGPRTATVEWPGPPAEGYYRGEIRELALRDRELEISWRRHSRFKAEPAGEKVQGTFSDLDPGMPYTVRVIPSGSDAPVAVASFQTPPLPRKRPIFTWTRLLVAAALALVAVVATQRWNARNTSL